MVDRNIALIVETKKIPAAELKRGVSALQKRLNRDVAPIWEVSAKLQVYENSEGAGSDAWPVLIRDDIHQPGAMAYHSDKHGSPFAMVRHEANWPFLVSHTLVEMLVDPLGKRLAVGPDPRPGRRKEMVNYVMEVCDPCNAEANGYEINGIPMADFCTPSFYDATAKPPARFTFNGKAAKPFQILRGGYMTWQETKTRHWWQTMFFGRSAAHHDLGAPAGGEGESSARRRVSMQMVILRQTREAPGLSSAGVKSAIEELIREYGTAQ